MNDDSRASGLATKRKRVKRAGISLTCMKCGARNYKTTKQRKDGSAPLTLKKHCKECNQHTEHREAR